MSASVFPARAGMSLPCSALRLPRDRVPRASGDEPQKLTDMLNALECSPRERG